MLRFDVDNYDDDDDVDDGDDSNHILNLQSIPNQQINAKPGITF